MERKYYGINESGAKVAHEMMSFSDYVSGSRTAEYRSLVDEVYDTAEKVEQLHPELAEKAQMYADRYSRKMANYINTDISIGTRCPSVMIAGPANFPVRKKEKQIQAWESNQKNYQYAEKIKRMLSGLLNGKQVIMSGDENAVELLQEKVNRLEQLQEHMKKENAEYRKNNKGGNDAPYKPWQLSNNRANLKATKRRLESLQKAKSVENTETEYDGFKVVRNTDLMRLQIVFDGKPEERIRDVLKKNGFRWSPKNGAWQRQLTSNAEYSLKKIVENI